MLPRRPAESGRQHGVGEEGHPPAGKGLHVAIEAVEARPEVAATKNIRRLEGALMRVASLISLTGGNPSQDRVEVLLKDLLQEEARRSVSMCSLWSFGVRDGFAVMVTTSPYFNVVLLTP